MSISSGFGGIQYVHSGKDVYLHGYEGSLHTKRFDATLLNGAAKMVHDARNGFAQVKLVGK